MIMRIFDVLISTLFSGFYSPILSHSFTHQASSMESSRMHEHGATKVVRSNSGTGNVAVIENESGHLWNVLASSLIKPPLPGPAIDQQHD
jgi:hypothetical protein